MSPAVRACGPWQTSTAVHSPRCVRGQLTRSGRKRNDYRAKVEQKYMDMSVEQEVKRVERLHRLADDLMDKLDQAIKELNEMCSVEHQDGEYKVVRVPGVAVDRAGAKQISSSLKDVKDLLNVRDDVAAGAPEVQVVLSDEVKKYAK